MIYSWWILFNVSTSIAGVARASHLYRYRMLIFSMFFGGVESRRARQHRARLCSRWRSHHHFSCRARVFGFHASLSPRPNFDGGVCSDFLLMDALPRLGCGEVVLATAGGMMYICSERA